MVLANGVFGRTRQNQAKAVPMANNVLANLFVTGGHGCANAWSRN
jgi:hypothetical protein